MISSSPRVGIPFFEPTDLPDIVSDAGAEPVPLRLPTARPPGGVALAREWIADLTTVSCAPENLDALAFDTETPAEVFGMILAAGRLNLPLVCAAPKNIPLHATLAALGLTSLNGHLSDIVSSVGSGEIPSPRELVDNFSLANAVRVVALGGGMEEFVHLAAVAREMGVVGFSQIVRVLGPETSAVGREWLESHGAAGLLAHLADALHEVPAVGGRFGGVSAFGVEPPPEGSRLVFARGKASGAEVICRVATGVLEVSGTCRVFDSEADAVEAVAARRVGEGDVLVVRGCGPRGGPGLLRLDHLADVLRETEIPVPVLTDGLAPQGAPGVWGSLFAPEAAIGGVVGRLRDGDGLRLDLMEGRIKAVVEAEDLALRGAFEGRAFGKTGYVGRYTASALSALEGAGFG